MGSGARDRAGPAPSARSTQPSTRGPRGDRREDGAEGVDTRLPRSPLPLGLGDLMQSETASPMATLSPLLVSQLRREKGTASPAINDVRWKKWGDRSPPRTEGTMRSRLPLPSWGRGSKSLGLPDLFFLIFYLFLRQRERERETEREREKSMSREGAEREGDTESETGSRLRGISTEPDAGSNSQTVRSRPEPKSDAYPTKPPRRPCLIF